MFNSNLARKQKTQINVTDGSTVEARWGEPGCVRHRQTHRDTHTHSLKTKCRLHTHTYTHTHTHTHTQTHTHTHTHKLTEFENSVPPTDTYTHTQIHTHTHTNTQFENCRIVLTFENSQSRARLRLDPAGLPKERAPLQAGPRFRPHRAARLPSPLSSLAPTPPPQRKRKCLACIKLDSKDQVLGRMVHCPIQTQVQRVRRGLLRCGETGPWERPGWRGWGGAW